MANLAELLRFEAEDLNTRADKIEDAYGPLRAALQRDKRLADSLRRLYLDPLGDPVLVKTLRAYYATGYNASEAATLLRVNRRTVASRLKAAERQIGSLVDKAMEIQAALLLEAIENG